MAPNIAVIVLDSLRSDYFEEHFDWVPGKRFMNAYSTAHWTIPAHASLFTGYYASEIGVYGKSPEFDPSLESLPKQLQDNGYTTRCFTANPNLIIWGQTESGFSEVISPSNLRNGDNYIDWAEFNQQTDSTGCRKFLEALRHCITADCSTISAIKEGLERWREGTNQADIDSIITQAKSSNFGDKEFLLVNIMEPHTPYIDPDSNESLDVVIGEAFAGNVNNGDQLRSTYSRVSENLARKYKTLYEELSDDFDHIITLSDHGEMLGEHDMWNHGYGLFPQLVNIPLVIDGEGFEEIEEETPVNLLDIHKTIASKAGLNVDSRGRKLHQPIPDEPLLTEYHGFLPWHRDQLLRHGVTEDEFKRLDQTTRGIVLPDGKYVYEDVDGNLQSTDEFDEEKVSRKLSELKESLNEKSVSFVDSNIDDDVEQRLRELGYA